MQIEDDKTKDIQTVEQVQEIPISQIHPFEGHPFKVMDDELMQQTVDSITQFGVLNPVIIRPDEDGYEMVSGHRRLRASELAGKDTIPAICRNMTDDEAIILMVDSNLQRESLLPSERAWAYKLKMDALKHQGKRLDLWYKLQGDYFIPCLVLEEVDTQPIGMWGRKHLRYIKEHRPTLYADLLTSGKLSSYLAEVDNQAKEMFDLLVKQMAEKQGITEQLKAQDQMCSVRPTVRNGLAPCGSRGTTLQRR